MRKRAERPPPFGPLERGLSTGHEVTDRSTSIEGSVPQPHPSLQCSVNSEAMSISNPRCGLEVLYSAFQAPITTISLRSAKERYWPGPKVEDG